MKRSEMLFNIAKALDDSGFTDIRNAKYITETIIMPAIEKAGMLPPPDRPLDIASGRILHYHIPDSIEKQDDPFKAEENYWAVNDVSLLWEPEE